jgi:hypothetical protein
MRRKILRRILNAGRKVKCPVCGKKKLQGSIEEYGGRCYACARQKWIDEYGPLSENEVFF